ncbi:MAG: exo-alpha-sialidase [Phycisphaerae bacterium]|nr:exo-alpha-sialidase [Phycisphaerae bacterium]
MSFQCITSLCSLAMLAQGATIRIDSFSLEPRALKLGEAFDVRVSVDAKDVPVLSCVLRTTDPVPKESVPPPFSYYHGQRRLAFVADGQDVHLRDNGRLDLDPGEKRFRFRVETKGWKPGRYGLSVLAHNRPGGGAHVVDERRFVVLVEADRVRLEDLGRLSPARFVRCELTPAIVDPGQRCELRIEAATEAIDGVQIRQTYYVAREHVPPGFSYDATKRMGYLADAGTDLVRDNGAIDANPAQGRLDVPLDTTGWKPGLYHVEITLRGTGGGKADVRNLALTIRSPNDRFDVQVSPSWRMCAGTHAERMTRLTDGTLLHVDLFSTDDGRTWLKRPSGTIGAGAEPLRDGRVIGMAYRTLPVEGREGWYRGQRYESLDHGRTVTGPLEAEFHVPEAKAAHGHAFHPGPLYMRSIVERKDGSLLALMAGWFKSDTTPCPHNPKRPYSRTYVCESSDGGKTWRYVSTIGYDHIGSEGYNEGAMVALPDGRLMAVLRTGSMRDPKCQDNPIMQSYSEDGGRTWSKPTRTGAAGAFPDLLVLSDGTLAASYGRPGACLMLSADLGKTWTDHTVVDTTPYSGYTTIVEIGPGEILMAFGTRDYLDPGTGKRDSQIRLATIRYQRRGRASGADVLDRFRHAGATLADLGGGFYEGEMRFDALGGREKFALHLPEGYAPKRQEPYPLIVFLHGAGRHHLTLVDMAPSREVLKRSPCVVLLPNGRGSWWVDSPVDPASRYQSYLRELMRVVGECLNVSPDPARRGIGGWSMGGFGSANYLADHPKQFDTWVGIVALLDFPNPTYPPEHNHAVPAVLGSVDDWAKLNPIAKAEAFRGKQILLLTADRAFDRKMNEAFAGKLHSLGIDHDVRTLNGGHTIDVVQSALPQAMDFFHDHLMRCPG